MGTNVGRMVVNDFWRRNGCYEFDGAVIAISFVLKKVFEKWRVPITVYAPLFLWIAVIFYLSSDQGSMSATSQFIRPILKFLFPAASEETLQIYHGNIRKLAHFTEYAILAFLGFRVFQRPVFERLRRYPYIATVILVTAIAVIDELNQSFEPSRTGSVRDIFIDFSGGLAMVVFLWIVNLSGNRHSRSVDGHTE